MSIGSRAGIRKDDRAALRLLYLNIVASTVGLASYDDRDDTNLDILDGIVASVYARMPNGDKGAKGDTGPVGVTGVNDGGLARLPPAGVVAPEFEEIDPEAADREA